MATLGLQVVPARPEDRDVLLEATMRGQLARNPNHWFVRTVLGSALKSQGQYQEAIEHLQEAVRLAPGNPAPHFNLGNTKLAMGRLDESLEHYRRVLAIEPNHPKVNNNIAVAYQQRGDTERALEHYRAQLALSPEDSRAYANMGTALLELDRLAPADEAFRRALDLDPESTQALEGRGDVGRLRDDRELAEIHYRRALELDPDSPAAQYGLGRVRLAQGRPEQARDHLGHAMRADGAYVGVLNDDAWHMATHPDPDQRAPAKAVFLAEIVNEHTEHRVPELLDTLAAALAADGRFDSAIGTLEKAMNLAGSGNASVYMEEFRERLVLYQRGEPYTDLSDN
jgi:tetratricopeptide (TPR) repeat protein